MVAEPVLSQQAEVEAIIHLYTCLAALTAKASNIRFIASKYTDNFSKMPMQEFDQFIQSLSLGVH